MTQGSHGEDLRCGSVTRVPPLTASTQAYATETFSVSESVQPVLPTQTPLLDWDPMRTCVYESLDGCCKQTYIILHRIPRVHRPMPMSPDLKNTRIPAHFIWRDPGGARRLTTEQRWQLERECAWMCLSGMCVCVWGSKSSANVSAQCVWVCFQSVQASVCSCQQCYLRRLISCCSERTIALLLPWPWHFLQLRYVLFQRNRLWSNIQNQDFQHFHSIKTKKIKH